MTRNLKNENLKEVRKDERILVVHDLQAVFYYPKTNTKSRFCNRRFSVRNITVQNVEVNNVVYVT